ncbi:MAG: histidine phosphatase family protein [Candidatus Riflebacteria bacterium]|nr:histidine phosphatase family protein [Candidatus Riflebacteria bacterium]
MRLYLIRHGAAVDAAGFRGPDASRPLTAEGRCELTKLFKRMRRKETPPVAIWASPLVRAVQTAELCAFLWGDRVDVDVSLSLVPEAPTPEVLAEIAKSRPDSPLALVGHEPFLSTLLVQLTGSREGLSLPKASITRVRFRPDETPAGRFARLHAPKLEQPILDLEKLYQRQDH